MYDNYYSIAQTYSTQYLKVQIEKIKHHTIKSKAFNDVLKTRLLKDGNSFIIFSLCPSTP